MHYFVDALHFVKRAGARGLGPVLLALGLLTLTSASPAQDDLREAGSIARMKPEEEITMRHRKVKSTVTGELLQINRADGVIIKTSNNPSGRDCKFTDYDFVFCEGLTNAAELVEGAQALLDGIDRALEQLPFVEGLNENDRIHERINPPLPDGLLEQLPYLGDRNLTQDGLLNWRDDARVLVNRIRDPNRAMPANLTETFTGEDRNAILVERTALLDHIEAVYPNDRIRNEYRIGRELQRQHTVPYRRRLNELHTPWEKGDISRALDRCNRLLQNLFRDIGDRSVRTAMQSGLEELEQILTAVVEQDRDVADVSPPNLEAFAAAWERIIELCEQADHQFYLGPRFETALAKHHERFRERKEQIDHFVTETKDLVGVFEQFDDLVRALRGGNLEQVEQQARIATLRETMQMLEVRFEDHESPQVRQYARKQFEHLQRTLKTAETNATAFLMIGEGQRLIDAVDGLTGPDQALETAKSLQDVIRDIKRIQASGQVSGDPVRDMQRVETAAGLAVTRSLRIGLSFHQAAVNEVQKRLYDATQDRDIDVTGVSRALRQDRMRLASVREQILEVAGLSELLEQSTEPLLQRTDELEQRFPSVLELMQLRQEAGTIPTAYQSRDELQQANEQVAALMARIPDDLKDEQTLRLRGWVEEDLNAIQQAIERQRPLITFQEETQAVAEEIRRGNAALSGKDLPSARQSLAFIVERSGMLSGWMEEHSQLRTDEFQRELADLQRGASSLSEQIAVEVRAIRRAEGWLPVDEKEELLVPPTPEHRSMLALLAVHREEFDRAKQLLSDRPRDADGSPADRPDDDVGVASASDPEKTGVPGELPSGSPLRGPAPASARITSERVLLSEARQAEESGDLRQALALYRKLEAMDGQPALARAGRGAGERLQVILTRAEHQSQARMRGLVVFFLAGLGMLLLFGVWKRQSKGVKLQRARSLLRQAAKELRAGRAATARRLVDQAGAILAQFPEDDSEVQSILEAFAPTLQKTREQESTDASVSLPELSEEVNVEWLRSVLQADESTVAACLDWLPSSGGKARRKTVAKVFEWLREQLAIRPEMDSDELDWRIRQLQRLCAMQSRLIWPRLQLAAGFQQSGRHEQVLDTIGPMLHGKLKLRREEMAQVLRMTVRSLLALEKWKDAAVLVKRAGPLIDPALARKVLAAAQVGMQLHASESNFDPRRIQPVAELLASSSPVPPPR
jgi:hypothetical protein